MRRNPWTWVIVTAFAAALCGLAGAAAAQDAAPVTILLRPGLQPAQVDALVNAAKATGRPVTIRWDEAPGRASGAAAPAAMPETDPALMTTFEAGLAKRIDGLGRLREMPRNLVRTWNETADGATLSRLAIVLSAAAAAALAVRWLIGALRRRRTRSGLVAPPSDLIDRLRRSIRRVAADVAALLVFLVVGLAALRMPMPVPDLAQTIGTLLIRVVASVSAYAIVGRFLLAPTAPEDRLLPLPNAEWHYRMLVAYAIVGQIVVATVVLAQRSGSDPVVVEGWFLIGSTLITLQKVAWFWIGRHDIAATLIPAQTGRSLAGLLRRTAAHALPYLFIAIALLIWAVGNVTVVSPEQGAHWGAAAGATQVISVVLPILAIGVGAIGRAFIARHHADEPATPARLAAAATARTLLAGGIWVAGIYVVAQVWDAFLRDPTSLAAVRAAVRISAALVVGWAIWTFLRTFFEAHAPRHRHGPPGIDAEEAEPLVQSRLATVLPIVRDLALGATFAITALVVLSAMGVDIAPLLAGFGVIGLAISFGSQALVRDIVSGIFFMTDDAFRIGEYIDTGRLKGTVEKITLRSVQLRHQNGQIHTVPFGQLQAITNFSRDWATMKFTIRLDREADIEKTRKVIKRVGTEMAADPELGPEFLQPLKMQGVQEITDTAIVIRCKFTSTPAKPSWIQREALKRIHRAMVEAGILFASNAVTVRGGSADAANGAAVAMLPPPVAPAS